MGIIQGLMTTECNIVREHTCVNASLNMNIPSKKPRQSLIGLNCFSSPSSNRQPFHSVGTWEAPAILGAQTLWRWYSSSALQSGSSVVSWLRNSYDSVTIVPLCKEEVLGPPALFIRYPGKVQGSGVSAGTWRRCSCWGQWGRMGGGGEVKCGEPG